MSLNSMCKKVRDARKDSNHCCKFYRNTNDSVIPNGSRWDISDIEDMHKLGKTHVACPYYLQKIRVQFADLILMPYNYLIDPKIRENFKINFENSIIIMDEAHNVERVAEDVASFEIHVNSMYQIINELMELENDIKNQSGEKKYMSSAENVNEILLLTQNFQHYIKSFNVNDLKRLSVDDIKETDGCYSGRDIFQFFFTGTKFKEYKDYKGTRSFEGLQPQNFGHWNYTFEKCLADLSEKMNGRPSLERWWDALKKVMRLYKQIYPSEVNKSNRMNYEYANEIDDYYMFIKQDDVEFDKKRKYTDQERDNRLRSCRTLGFWCFNPGLGFKKIQQLKPRTIILTSGTLTPMTSFQQELMMDFPIKIENKHVIQKEQAKISILTNGVKGNELIFSHKLREAEGPIHDLGETLIKITEITPGGMLIFFPSYQMMAKFYETWEQSGYIKRLEKLKGVYQEPRESSHYKFVISAFYQDVYKKGAIIFAVCRGKISEGLDFSDDAARCVIIIGIPYPMTIDPKTILKKHHLDKSKHGLSGQQWYCQQATRATNQSIGRVIRHVNDYGNIILIDKRFDSPQQKDQITSWLRDRVQVYNDPHKAIGDFKQFFDQMQKKGFKPKVQHLDQVKLDFADMDEDPNIKDAVEELRRRGQEIHKLDLRKRKYDEVGPEKKNNPETDFFKRQKTLGDKS